MHRNEEVEEGRKETVHPLHFAFVPCVDCPRSNTGFFGDLVQKGFLKAVSKKFRISSLNDPIIQEMIPSVHVFTPLRLNNREPLIYTITVRTGYNPSRFQEDGLEVLL